MAVDITTSPRGFEHYGEHVQTSYGHTVKVYESSSAVGPHCWLGVVKDFRRSPADLPECDVAAHLSLEQAIAVRDRLTAFIESATERWDLST